MADETSKKEKESAAVLTQFKKNLDHILISGTEKGPELTIGKTVLTFLPKAPVSALAHLIGDSNQVDGMKNYLLGSLTPGQEDALNELLKHIDMEGLGEILGALGEGYTSFPETP